MEGEEGESWGWEEEVGVNGGEGEGWVGVKGMS